MSSGQRPTLFDVVEVSGNDIYAGSDRDVLHFDGSTWQSMNPTGSRYFDHVWASASDDVYATGDEVVHYDGSAWKAAIPIEPQSPNSVWADSRGRLVVGGRAVIYRLENGAWSKEGGDSLRDDVDAIDGNAWDDLYAATYYGVYHSTGAVWTLMPSSPGSMTHLSVVPSGEIYASNGYQVFRYDGNTWTKIQEVNVFSGYEALEAVSPNDAFFGYADGILRFNGSSWTRLYDDACGDIWAASPTNIYATGARVVLHSDGGQFTPVGPVVPDGLTAIQGASADYILGVGRNGYVLWKDGRWLTGPNEYPGYIIDLVAGRDGSIVRFDGRQRTGTYLLAYNTE
jgi:hypothetical protein